MVLKWTVRIARWIKEEDLRVQEKEVMCQVYRRSIGSILYSTMSQWS